MCRRDNAQAADSGTRRQRSPGAWEIRVGVGTHPLTGRSKQRSLPCTRGEEYAAWSEAVLYVMATPLVTVPRETLDGAARQLTRIADAEAILKADGAV